jgi:transcriptional regulator with XRE-family HTH domain
LGSKGIFAPGEAITVIADGTPSAVAQVASPRPAHMRSYVSIAGNGEDIPTPTEIAAADAEAEALREQRHTEETVLAAQAEHARQRAFLQQFGEEDEADAPVQHAPLSAEALRAHMAYPEPLPTVAAPKMPVARGRSTRTLEASAQTPVVKAPLRGRSAPPPAPQVPPPAAPVRLPTWPAKAPVVSSDPPPKRDRRRNCKVAPKPAEPVQPVLLGMSPETTTPTTAMVRRPHRKKVDGVRAPATAPKVTTPRPPKAVPVPRWTVQDIDAVMSAGLMLPADLRAEVRRAVELLYGANLGAADGRQNPLASLADEEAVWRKRSTEQMRSDGRPWSKAHRDGVDMLLRRIEAARAAPVDLETRQDEIRLNRSMAIQCPAYPSIAPAAWTQGIARLVNGTLSYFQFAKQHKVNHNTLASHLRRNGVRNELFAEVVSRRGMRPDQQRRSLLDTSPVGLMFGCVLRKLRAQYAMTQIEVAVGLDVSPSIVSYLEQGRTAPCVAILTRTAVLFKTDWRSLLPAASDAELVRLLVEATVGRTRSWSCANVLRHLVLPYLGIVLPSPPAKKKVNP